ncbi:MAG: hypothetical protein ABUS57_10225 [Pseudomonadota bacterium]
MRASIAAAAVFLGLAGSFTVAEAQFRSGQPETLTPPPAPVSNGPSAQISSFARAYAAHGKPRVIVFWNRELSDSVVTPWVDELSIDRYAGSTVIQSRTFSEDPGKRAPQMATAPDWKVQGRYQSAMLQGGVRMIDRRASMRFSAAGKAAGVGSNITSIETKSLQGSAEILVEILLAPDPDSPTSYVFQATILSTKTGQILGSFVTSASSPPTDLGYKASANGGFERVIVQAPFERMGDELALQTMSALQSAWR